MQILLDSNSVAVIIGTTFELTLEGTIIDGTLTTQYTTANSSVIDEAPPSPLLTSIWAWQNGSWVCIDQPALDAFIAQQTADYNKSQSNRRLLAYIAESDPIYFLWQRQQATQQEWLDKVAEIDARFPYAT